MNKIYKVIWSRVRNCYVVVSELAKRAGKEKNCHLGPAAHLAAGALCLGLLTFGGQVLPAEAAGEPTVADTTQNQYVAFRVTVNDGNVRGNDNGRDTNTFNGATYHKVTLSDGKTQYWVRDGYTLTEGTAEKYTALSRTDSKFDVAYTGSGKQPADILSSATSAVSSAGVSTNAGETLNQVTASAFEGLSQGGGTQVPGNWDYIIYDPSWEGHTQANTSTRTYYKDGYADMYNRSASATGSPLGFVTTTDANTKLVWNGTLNQYTYNGHAVDTSHLYVIGGKLGVFTSYDGSEVYTGTVYGANNEILMTAMKDGKYYSYWAAPVTDPNATMGTYRVSDYNKDLETLKDNDVALYHNDIKSVDLAKGGDTANPSLTITAMRNGNGTAQAVDGAITVTGGGGTGGQDTTVTLSNTTNGSTVSQVFTTGSKVTANTTAAPSAATEMKSLTINGTTYATDLKFGGDNHASTTLTKNLSEELDILGGADSTKLTDGNIGVNASNGTLKVQLAQNVDLTSAGSLTVGNTKIDTSGLTITHTDSTGASNNVILTGSQVSMGGNQITNVASGGDTGTNGANINDIIRVSQAKNIATGDKNITVTSSTDTSTNVRTTTVELNDTVTLGSNAANQVTLDGTKGTVSIGNTGDASSKNAIQLDGTAGTAKVGAITIGQQTFDYSYQQPVVSSSGGLSLQTATGTASGTFVTGLSNTTWTPGNYVSGRAATEDELEQAGRHFLSIGTTAAENTLANYYNDGATGTNSMAFGVGTKSSGNFAVSMGINSTASGLGALAVGYNSAASGTESVAVGTQNNASGNYSVALGVGANAGTANTDSSSTANGAAVAVGFTALATRTGSSAYGYNAQATADEGTALGVASLASVEGGVALGAHSVANTAEGVKGYLAETTDTSPTWVSTGGAVSLGGKTTDEEGNAITVSRQITNLAAGSEDTDAVNVAQLRSLEREGMNFQGNNTDTTVHMNQGGTLQVQGTGTKAATEYSGENILVTGVSETADDGKTVTTKLNIGLDKNIRVDSVTAGQATTDSVQGYAGSVKIVGPSADSTQYVATSLGVGYGTADVTGTNINRLQYIDGDGTTRHAVATLEDGLKLAGDAGTGTVKLDSTLSVTGGEGASANLASGNNIGVTASDGALKLQLAKDLTGLNSVTAGTVVMGSQADGSDATQTGDFVTGLDNKTWTVGTTKAVSGRAATEDQLNVLSTQLKDNLANSTYSITAGGSGNTGTDTVTAKLGTGTIRIFGDAPVVTSGGDGDGWDRSKANILTKVKYDSANNSYVSVELQDHLEVGVHQVTDASGNVTTEGVDGTMQFKGSGSSEVNISGDNGITLTHIRSDGNPAASSVRITGPSESDGKELNGAMSITTFNQTAKTTDSAASIYGESGEGHLYLNTVNPGEGQGNAAGLGASADVVAQYGAASLDAEKNDSPSSGGAAGTPIMTRLTYTDQSGKTHQAATMDDGLLLTGDSGTVTRLLNSTLKLSGGVTDKDKLSDGANLGVVANAAGDGFDIKLAKDLTGLDSITLNGGLKISGSTAGANTITGLSNTTWNGTAVSGRAATEDQLQAAVAGVTDASKGGGFGLTDDAGKAAKADLGGTVGIHGDRNITTSVSSDGKSINVGLNKDVDLGNDGSIKAGGVTIDSSGIDAGSKNITNVKSGLINHDASDNTNAANIGDVKSIASDAANAAVSGGRVFQGDDGADNKVTVTMGTALKLTGGQTDTAKLTDGNIGVVKNADGDGLDIKLSKELTGLTSVTAGNSTLNNEGLTVNNSTGSAGTTVTGSGIKIAANGENTHAVEISNSNVSLGGQQIHDVAAGTKPTDAVNVSQLGGVVSGVSNAITRLDSRVDRVGAGASALAALHPLEYDPEDKLNFAAGFGHYRSANAAAIGAFYQPTESVRFNVGGSFGGGENMVNAGVTFSLDPQRRDRFQSRIALMRTVQQLRSDNETLRQDNQKVHAQLDAMNDRLNQLSALVEQLSAKK